MTPIGSTSPNSRRAIEFILYSSCAARTPVPTLTLLGRRRAAKLIARRRLTDHRDGRRREPGHFGLTFLAAPSLIGGSCGVGGDMGFYDDRVLPHLINVVMNTKQTREIRQRVCSDL